jgi:hypothetical protein
MPPESHDVPEQEVSIKERAHQLFVPEASPERATKPFPVYLRETPAVPISATIKALLWMVGIIVGLLFIGAVWRLVIRHGPQRHAAPARRVAQTEARFWLEAIVQPANQAALPDGRDTSRRHH